MTSWLEKLRTWRNGRNARRAERIADRKFAAGLQWHVAHHDRINNGGLNFGIILRSLPLDDIDVPRIPALYWPLYWAWLSLVHGHPVTPQIERAMAVHLPPERLEVVLSLLRADKGIGIIASERAALRRIYGPTGMPALVD